MTINLAATPAYFKLFKSLHACSSSSYIHCFEAKLPLCTIGVICHSSTPVLTCACHPLSFFSLRQSVSNLFLTVLHLSRHYKQSLHSATWPRWKSLQGQRRLYLGECPAQLKRRGSRWRPHSRRTTEKAGRMWLISESITSHCTFNLRG